MDHCKPKKFYDCMPTDECMPVDECMPTCEPMPTSGQRCVGTYSMRYRVYENCNCEYVIRRVCAYCGSEYEDQRDECPRCGAPADMGSMDNPNNDPPFDPDGFGRRRFRFFPRFGFFPFFPFFFPFFFFRRRRF